MTKHAEVFARLANVLNKQYATAGFLTSNAFNPNGTFRLDPARLDQRECGVARGAARDLGGRAHAACSGQGTGPQRWSTIVRAKEAFAMQRTTSSFILRVSPGARAAFALIGWLALATALAADNPPTPPSQAQFGGQCTEGLAQGRHVVTDCSVTWTDKDGKVYCLEQPGGQKGLTSRTRVRICRRRAISSPRAASVQQKAMQYFDSDDARRWSSN